MVTDDERTEPPHRPFISGPALRQLRQSKGITLRKLAREARLSHGHLSKVERGEIFRPVTPAIITAYERLTGEKLRPGGDGGNGGWRIGHLSAREAAGFAATVAAVAMGGAVTSPYTRTEPTAGRLISYAEAHRLCPLERVNPAGLSRLRALTDHLEAASDEISGLAAREILVSVALPLVGDHAPPQVPATAGRLARLAAQALAVRSLDAARGLYLIALSLATAAGDPELSVCVLADIAQLLVQTGNDEIAARVARFSLHDERVSDQTRARLAALSGTTTNGGGR